LDLLTVGDFLPGDAIDRDPDPVENDDRAICLLEDRLIFLVQLLADLEIEILAALRRAGHAAIGN
jgi:hypothetical protein